MNYIINLIKKLVYSEKYNSKTYIKFLRKSGMQIGDNCAIYVPTKTQIDTTRPWLITIGNNVSITEGVTILTHGYDWSVLKGIYGEVLGSSGKVKIGNNVFIGVHSTILKGVTIGDNVIIGANSLVNKDIPNNCVAAGNPCEVIMTIEEYYKKRKKAQLYEAKELVESYRKRYGKNPNEEILREFFWLFSDNPNSIPSVWEEVNNLCGNSTYTNAVMKKHKKSFENIEEFLESIPMENDI